MSKRHDSKKRVLRTGEVQRKDGKYTYSVNVNGKRHYIYANSLQSLREKEEEIQDQINRGLDITEQKIKLNSLAATYFAGKEKTVQSSSYRTMTVMYDKYIRDEIGDMKLKEIKRSTIKNLYIYLITREKPISVSTLGRLDCVLTPMLETAVYDDILLKNPARGVLGEVKRECHSRPKKIRALTADELEKFMAYINNTDKHSNIRNLLKFLTGTGCRIGEAIGLCWDDLDFAGKKIHINRSVQYVMENGHHKQYIKDPKSAAGKRVIPMFDFVKEALLDEKEKQEILGLEQPVLDGCTDFVFLSRRGRLHTRENVCSQIKQIVREHNKDYPYDKLEEFSTHQLRHTFATLLCKNSQDLKAIQSILGHANITTTLNTYADATEEGIIETMHSVEDAMFKRIR